MDIEEFLTDLVASVGGIGPIACPDCTSGNADKCQCACVECVSVRMRLLLGSLPSVTHDKSKEQKKAAGWKGSDFYGHDSDVD